MALIISLELHEDFYIANEQFVLASIRTPDAMTIERKRDGKRFTLTDAHATEIAIDVYASAGKPIAAKRARCAIDAPRDIKIKRGVNYRESLAHV